MYQSTSWFINVGLKNATSNSVRTNVGLSKSPSRSTHSLVLESANRAWRKVCECDLNKNKQTSTYDGSGADNALDAGLLDTVLLGDRLLTLVALAIARDRASGTEINDLEDLVDSLVKACMHATLDWIDITFKQHWDCKSPCMLFAGSYELSCRLRPASRRQEVGKCRPRGLRR